MTLCKQCGECCRYVVMRMFGVSGPWLEYWSVTRNAKFIYRLKTGLIETTTTYRGKEGLEGLLILSPCPHLKLQPMGPDAAGPFMCDIFTTRPHLCRLSSHNVAGFMKYPGCTDEPDFT
jgi:Fe-S-cluster containining protein